MKAKKITPEKNEQPNPLPTPSDDERKDSTCALDHTIVVLARARLRASTGSSDESFTCTKELLGSARSGGRGYTAI